MFSFFQLSHFSLLMFLISAHPQVTYMFFVLFNLKQNDVVNSINHKKWEVSSPIDHLIEKELSKEFSQYFIQLLTTNELYGKWQTTDTSILKGKKPKDGYSTVSEYIRQEPFHNIPGIKLCYYGSKSKEETTLCLKLRNFVSFLQTSLFNESKMYP